GRGAAGAAPRGGAPRARRPPPAGVLGGAPPPPPTPRPRPSFPPVLDGDYAIRTARDWNVKHDGAGFVTRFEVESEFLARYPVQRAGGRTLLELWIPAEELDEFNAHIVGEIEFVHEFTAAP
ncbi:hypothetical protein, partial [Streptomyces hirsutus]|uniref:hypothetical protein n=1 Tax=Streptomyces hirsutus TaxID=35620 RepID=UPI0036478D27